MPGLTAKTKFGLDCLARNFPGVQPLVLRRTSANFPNQIAVLVSVTGLQLADDAQNLGEMIGYDEIEHATIWEGINSRYKVELALANDGEDRVLLFDSRVQFMMFFAALRANAVACRFDFTKDRQQVGVGAASDPLVLFGCFTSLLASVVAAIAFSSVGATFGEKIGLGGFIGLVFCTIAPAVVLFTVFCNYATTSSGDSLPLVIPAPLSRPVVTLDDRPVALALIAAETHEWTDAEVSRSASDFETKQISDIERLLE